MIVTARTTTNDTELSGARVGRLRVGRSMNVWRPTALVAWTLVVAAVTLVVPAGPASAATQQAKLIAADAAAFDEFGSAVAISGDTAVVGARRGDDGGSGDSGSAYVFTRDGASAWTQQTKLTASDGVALDDFGFSVAISGDTAVIGAPFNDLDGTLPNAGAVYVFTRDGAGTWTQQAKLTADDAASVAKFGHSVATTGDTAVIGAPGDSTTGAGSFSGAAYVFTRDGTGTWTQQAKLTAADRAADDQFGTSVAVDGDTAVVGVPMDDNPGDDTGSAHVFTRDGAGTWTRHSKLVAADGAAADEFGTSLALSGDTALIGAKLDDDLASNAGAVYEFTRDGAGLWTQQTKLTATDGTDFAQFGSSVALSGDSAVIGANRDTTTASKSGSAYVFTRDGTSAWTQQDKLTASDAGAEDFFGDSVAVAGDNVIIGARRNDGVDSDSGSVYVFDLAAATSTANGQQTSTVTVTDPVAPGVLTITLAQPDVSFGSLEAGTTSAATPVGDISYENTLDNGNPWGATVAATSLVDGTDVVPFTGLDFTPGASITPGPGATGTPTPGSNGTFTGTDTTPGATFSDSIGIVTAPATAQGTFTHTGSTATLTVPAETPAGTYTGTLQYTITG